MHQLARELWPINRSITGNGVRQTLQVLSKSIPNLKVHEVPSGTPAFDWVVPDEWNVDEAYIITPSGEKICDLSDNNLHLVSYSVPIDVTLPLEELQNHLYSLPEQPDAIPYVTSYYKDNWGFCLTHDQRNQLVPGDYKVVIRSKKAPGHLTYGELIIPGESKEEIFISTYICHPSMANNELSGPVVATFLAKWIETIQKHRYTYRFIFIPETIGSLVYLSRNLQELQERVFAGFNLTCVGDERSYSFLPSKLGNTPADQAAMHVLKNIDPNYKIYTWENRGSDERQYCSPGVDLPVVSMMRSKYWEFPEYHTSKDDLETVVTAEGLNQSLEMFKKVFSALEGNTYPTSLVLGEPQLGKRGLYSDISIKSGYSASRLLLNVLSYADGKTSALEIAERIKVPIWDVLPAIELLRENELVTTSAPH